MLNMAGSELIHLLCLWAESQPAQTVCRASHTQERRGGTGMVLNEVTPQLHILY